MFNNSKSILKKITVIFLVVTLTYYNFVLIGSNFMKGLISYALDDVILGTEAVNQEETDAKEPEIKFEIVSKDIHKTTMKEATKEYTESLKLVFNNVEGKASITLADKDYIFYNNEDEEINSEETQVANLKYVKTTVNKEELINILGEDGILTIKDLEGNIIAELSAEKINNQEIDEKVAQTFTLEVPVIEGQEQQSEQQEQTETRSYVTVSEDKVEIEYEKELNKLVFNLENIVMPTIEEQEEVVNEENDQAHKVVAEEPELPSFAFENTKCILLKEDDLEKDIESLKCLKENVDYEFTFINDGEEQTEPEATEPAEGEENEEEPENTVESVIYFKDTITRAYLEVKNSELTLGKSNLVEYKITLDTASEKAELFVNPYIVLELPNCVTRVNSENSIFTVENDSGVFTSKKVTTSSSLGKYYVVIHLEGEQTLQSIVNGNTIINLSLDLSLADEAEDENALTKMYYKNDTVTAYESEVGYGTSEVLTTLNEPIELQGPVRADSELPAEPQNGTEDETDPEQEQEVEDPIYFSAGATVGTAEPNEKYIAREGEEVEYNIYLSNKATEDNMTEGVSVKVEDIIPEGLEFISAGLYKMNTETNNYEEISDTNNSVVYNSETRKLTAEVNNFEAATKESIGTVTVPVTDEETGETTEKEIEKFELHPATRLLKIKVKTPSLAENTYSRSIINEVNISKNEEHVIKLESEMFVSGSFIDVSINTLSDEIKPGDTVSFEIKVENLGKIRAEGINVNVTIPEELRLYRIKNKYSTYSTNSNSFSDTINVNGEETYRVILDAEYKDDLGQEKALTITANIDGTEKTWTTTLLTNELVIGNDDESPEEEYIEPSADETPDDEFPIEEEPVEENPGEENPGEEQPGNENPGEEKPGNENPGEENPGEEKPSEEKPEQQKDFDLSLNQYLNKLTVTNSQGTTVYNYTDTQFAKIEIASKYMNESVVSLEYKIVVKNEGNVAGYARKIVDYLPKGLEFNSELNTDWYAGDDGNLYSVKYIDKLLNPGDTLELNLVLSKKMTNTNTGNVKNIAEIYEASNDQNLEDINSIPGSKIEKENDMSTVEIIIAVRTGTIIMYTVLAIVILAILVYGIYNTRKITLNKQGGQINE